MAKKEILTLDDLYNYYSTTSKNVRHFSSKESNKNIVVQSFGNIKFEKDEEDNDLTLVTLQACHTGENLNKFEIRDEVMNKALSSFLNKPILAFIHEVDGELCFYDHRMHQDDEGEIVYDEYPVGIIPESGNPHLEYDEEKENDYVVVNGYLFNEYSPAVDILEREGECAVSVELNISELSYNPKTRFMIIDDFTFSGVTLLGKKPNGDPVKPGMAGSNIKLGDFTNQNSIFSEDKMITMLEELNRKIDSLSNFSIKNIERKEDKVELNKELFEQLLAKYNKTEADIEFDYSELDDDALSTAFADAFEDKEDSSSEGESEINEDVKDEVNESENVEVEAEDVEATFDGEPEDSTDPAEPAEPAEPTEEPSDPTTEEPTTEPVVDPTEEPVVTPVVTEPAEDDDDDDHDLNRRDDGTDAEYLKKIQNNEVQYSATFAGETKTFSKSLNEVISALTELVNATYSEADNAWYSCEVYEDKTVRFDDWWMDKHYIQKYSVKDDVYSLKGERVEVFARYLTQQEIEALDGLKSKFEEVSDKLAKYEAEPEKMSILESNDYASIAESEEFVAFKAQEAHFNLSVDEVRAKADEMLLNAAKAGKVEFTETKSEKKVFGFRQIPTIKSNKGSSRYGKLFN